MRSSYFSRTIVPFGVGIALGAWGLSSVIVALDSSPAVPAPAVTIEEDSPQWDCLTMGNGVCGADMLTDDLREQAWNAWDSQHGWTMLPVDPSREYRVDVAAFAHSGLYQAPGTLVLADRDGTRFQYTVTYK